MNKEYSYSLRVWITTLLLSPLFALLTIAPKLRSFREAIELVTMLVGVPIMAILLGLITIPGIFVFHFFCRFLIKYKIPVLSVKSILSFLGIFFVCVPAYIFGHFEFTWDYALLILPYWVALFISIWIYKLSASPRQETIEYK